MKKITSIVITFLLFCSAYADTINSASKNTSVAVYGTQRTSTAIQPWVIPVAVAGAACNSTTDIVAVTSDHSSQLICQSGSWVAIGGGSDIASKTTQGYTRLPSGLIIQWGSTSGCYSHGGYYAATFPMPFPTAVLQMVGYVSNTINTVSTSTYCPMTSNTLSGFTFQFGSTIGIPACGMFRYTVIGY